jgi:tRNA (guanine37-N1)-methyltransferase
VKRPKLNVEILSLFPAMFEGFLASSIVARALEGKALGVRITDYRSFTEDKHGKVDDYAYGGFPGMVLQAQPVFSALQQLLKDGYAPVVYFTPQGRPLSQQILAHYASLPRVILVCGHYKELDQRLRDLAVSDEISLGDYVLSGGEIAAMAFVDGLARLIPGVLGDLASAASDSFFGSKPGLGFPCYSRPERWMGQSVPEVLRSGDHGAIEAWAGQQADSLTRTRRPELIKGDE